MIVTALLAMMGLAGGVVAMMWASIWFVTSEKVAFLWNHTAARSIPKILSVSSLTIVYCYVFEYSIFWTFLITILSVIILSLVMISSWVVRIGVVRRVPLARSEDFHTKDILQQIRLLILPACMPNLLAKHVMPNADLHNLRRLHLSNGFESVSIATEDNNVLDGMVYRERSMLKLESSKQKWIIMFLGNGAHYEHCADEARNLAISLGRNVLVFNYRGVGRSAGLALEEMDLIKDGAACLKFLLRNYQVTDTRNVVLFGHSLGGAIATSIHTTKSFQGHLINDRSFSSLASVPLSWIEIVPSVRRRSVTVLFSSTSHTRSTKYTGTKYTSSTFERISEICRQICRERN